MNRGRFLPELDDLVGLELERDPNRRPDLVRLRIVAGVYDIGHRVQLPDGREIAGVSKIGLALRPGDISRLEIELLEFDLVSKDGRQ